MAMGKKTQISYCENSAIINYGYRIMIVILLIMHMLAKGELMNKKFIVYQGEEFTIEWYFDSRGKCSASDYFEELPPERKKKLTHMFYLLGDVGKIFNQEKFRHEGNQIYAIKSAPDRFLCFFFDGSKIIVTNAFEKKSDKMPPREKEKALNAKYDYLQQCKEGRYYDEKK